MDMLVVQGGLPLSGTVYVDGAKNAALPIMAACLAIEGSVSLGRVPDLVDVRTMTLLLSSLGVDVQASGENSVVIDASSAGSWVAEYDLVRRMRASICVLGPLLARFGKARVSLPGGCNIGHRPVDLHLKGLAALGADIQIVNGYIIAECNRLQGAELSLAGPFGSTVTGTCNVLMAACVAKGRTVIRSAAMEPEVVDLGQFLIAAGAEIRGLGTSVIEVDGVDGLHAAEYQIVPDRIEAATLAIAAAATRGSVLIPNAPVDDLHQVLEMLKAAGVDVDVSCAGLAIQTSKVLTSVDVVAQPYPGIPTDCQAQFMALLTTVKGRSSVRDTVFPDRFMHASELLRMGATIQRHSDMAEIEGGTKLTGANVMASDLRASAALVIAALAADGISCVRRIYHLDRGYAKLERKLSTLGAIIDRVSDNEPGRPHYLQHINQQNEMPTGRASPPRSDGSSSANDHR